MKRVVLALLALVAFAGCGAQAQTSSADKFSDPDQKAVAEKIEDPRARAAAGSPRTSAPTSWPRRS
jgi:Ni/Co efflux regulator RcnB